jgi:CubicO group peptidase (beta-lactamase class C family)
MRRLLLNQTEFNFAPGSDLDFDNSNDWILQAVIAQAGKKPFEEWMQERVFKKLGMNSAAYLHAGESTPGLVHTYKFDKRGRTEDDGPNYPFSYPVLSMNDWLSWTRFFLHKDGVGSSWLEKRTADQTDRFFQYPGAEIGHPLTRNLTSKGVNYSFGTTTA